MFALFISSSSSPLSPLTSYSSLMDWRERKSETGFEGRRQCQCACARFVCPQLPAPPWFRSTKRHHPTNIVIVLIVIINNINDVTSSPNHRYAVLSTCSLINVITVVQDILVLLLLLPYWLFNKRGSNCNRWAGSKFSNAGVGGILSKTDLFQLVFIVLVKEEGPFFIIIQLKLPREGMMWLKKKVLGLKQQERVAAVMEFQMRKMLRCCHTARRQGIILV